MGEEGLQRVVRSEWGFIYAHQAVSLARYFGNFEMARNRDRLDRFASGDKTFFVMCSTIDKSLQEEMRRLARNNQYHLMVYDEQSNSLKIVHEAKASKVAVIMDYSVPRKLFEETFLFADDLPTLITGQDNLANVLYLNLLSTGRPFFWEELIFQTEGQFQLMTFAREHLSDQDFYLLSQIWDKRNPVNEQAAIIFAAPRQYRFLFKRLAQAIEDHHVHFSAQVYYLILRGLLNDNFKLYAKKVDLLKGMFKRQAPASTGFSLHMRGWTVLLAGFATFFFSPYAGNYLQNIPISSLKIEIPLSLLKIEIPLLLSFSLCVWAILNWRSAKKIILILFFVLIPVTAFAHSFNDLTAVVHMSVPYLLLSLSALALSFFVLRRATVPILDHARFTRDPTHEEEAALEGILNEPDIAKALQNSIRADLYTKERRQTFRV